MESGFKKLEKNALGCMYTATFILSAVLLGIMSGVVIYFDLLKIRIVLIVYVVIMILAILNVIISPYFRYHRYRYKLDEDALEIVEGYIFISHNIVPIERIQNIELQQGPIDRIYGVSKMTITTGGGEETLRFVSGDVVKTMSDRLKKRINQIAAEAREESKDGEEC